MRSRTRIAPFVPKMVRMKKLSKPLVCAWVRMKNATPKVIPARDMSIDLRLERRNRSAMVKFVLMVGTQTALLGHPDPHSLLQDTLVFQDDLLAWLETFEDLHFIQPPVTNFDGLLAGGTIFHHPNAVHG